MLWPEGEGFKYSVNDGGYIREEEISYEKAI